MIALEATALEECALWGSVWQGIQYRDIFAMGKCNRGLVEANNTQDSQANTAIYFYQLITKSYW